MKKPILPLVWMMFVLSAFSQAWGADRPKITGIDHVSFYTTSPDGVKKVYADTLGLGSADADRTGRHRALHGGKAVGGLQPGA